MFRPWVHPAGFVLVCLLASKQVQTNTQTDRQTDRQTRWSQYSALAYRRVGVWASHSLQLSSSVPSPQSFRLLQASVAQMQTSVLGHWNWSDALHAKQRSVKHTHTHTHTHTHRHTQVFAQLRTQSADKVGGCTKHLTAEFYTADVTLLTFIHL